jgi:hypothetical protein
MIDKLTPEQELLLAKYREDVFTAATSTVTDRPKAEAAACRLAELGGLKVQEVVWVLSPEQGKREYQQSWKLLQDSLWAPLKDSLQDSLLGSLRNSLEDSLRVSLLDSLWDSLRISPWDSLQDSLWKSLEGSLRVSLENSLQDSLRASLRASLRNSLLDFLRDSLWNSSRDAGWLTFYRFCGELAEYREEDQETLQLYQQLLDSCFACWILPGKIILCERPQAVEIYDEKLIGVSWSAE